MQACPRQLLKGGECARTREAPPWPLGHVNARLGLLSGWL